MTYRNKVATVYLLGFFLDLINMFIASVAFPAMATALHTYASALAWVSNGYIVGLTLIIPFSARLTRALGARRLFILSLVIFACAATAAGFSQSLSELIAWRVIQGLGGGLLIPVGQAMTWQQFNPHERAKISAAVMLVALLAPAFSPALGGILVQSLSWRWIFFATLPIALVTLMLAWLWLKDEPAPAKSGRFLHLSLLRDPLLRFAMLVYLCVPGMFIGVSIIGMFYLQTVALMTPATAGGLMLPWSIASFVAISFTGKYFNRLGPRPLIIAGCLLQAMGIGCLTVVTPAMPHDLLVVIFALMGAGGSLCSSTAQSSAFINIPRHVMPDASALWNINRQLSFLIGTTLLAGLLSALQPLLTPTDAWRWTFFVAAGITLLPLISALRLNNHNVIIHLQKEKP